MGNFLAVNVHKANQHDTKGGVFVFEKALFLYPTIEAGCADEGYRGIFKNTFEIFHNIRIDISKQIKPTFEVLPKRWRVERTFSWFGGYRRLAKDFEYTARFEENFIYIAAETPMRTSFYLRNKNILRAFFLQVHRVYFRQTDEKLLHISQTRKPNESLL